MKARQAVLWLFAGCIACSNNPTEFHDDLCNESLSGSAIECTWNARLEAGKVLEVFGITGDITVYPTSGEDVVVSWVKRGRQSDPAEVTVATVDHSGGITICAVYPDVPGASPNDCSPGGGHNTVNNNDVEVDFTILLPNDVTFSGTTVTGSIIAEGVNSDVFANTVTGDVIVSTTRLASANAVTGSVFAAIGLPYLNRDLFFRTVTGSVGVSIPAETNAMVSVTTVHGTVDSEFQLMSDLTGGLHGPIGEGGPMLTVETVTGDVSLRRGTCLPTEDMAASSSISGSVASIAYGCGLKK